MGNADTKLNFRKAIVQLTSKSQVRNFNFQYFFFYVEKWSSSCGGKLSLLRLGRCIVFVKYRSLSAL